MPKSASGPQALEALAAEKSKVLSRSFPLLDGVEDENGEKPKPSKPADTLEALLGGGGNGDGPTPPTE